MTKAERSEIRGNATRWPDTERCKRSILSFLTALDEKDALIADLMPYVSRYLREKHAEGSADAKLCFAELAALKARAEK